MADNVTPIRPAPPAPPTPKRARKPVERFRQVESMLDEHQARIYSARAVAQLASASMLDSTSERLIEQREKHRAAIEAIDFLLAPIQGIGSFADLVDQAKAREVSGG